MALGAKEAPRRGVRACVALLVVLHLLLAGQVSLFGARPGFLLAASCVVALTCGRTSAVVAGFVLGLLFDLTGSGPVGLTSLLYSVCGFVLGGIRASRPTEGILACAPQACAVIVACNLAYPLFLLAFGAELELGWALVARVVSGSLADALVGVACLWVLERLGADRTSGGVRLG